MIAPNGSFYRPELDTLRFFAFLTVFAHHVVVRETIHSFPTLAWFLRFPTEIALAGQFGVDLFFILSAYLISELLLREKANSGSISIGRFYARRVLRIWPLYYTFVLVSFVLPAFSPAVFPIPAFVLFLLLSGNIYFTLMGGFASPVAPLWSISIEEQFYLIWPWLVRSASRIQMLVASALIIMGAAIVRFMLLAHGSPRHAILFNSLTRMDGMGIGVLIALLLNRRIPSMSRGLRVLCFASAVACWLYSVSVCRVLEDGISPIKGMLGYGCGTAGALFLFLAFLGAPEDGIGFLAYGPLTYLGRISYGLYVFHQLGLEATKLILVRLFGKAMPSISFPIALVLTTSMAILSYRYFESPFLQLKRRFEYMPTSRVKCALPGASDSARAEREALNETAV